MAGYRERGPGDQKIREKNLGSGFHKLHFCQASSLRSTVLHMQFSEKKWEVVSETVIQWDKVSRMLTKQCCTKETWVQDHYRPNIQQSQYWALQSLFEKKPSAQEQKLNSFRVLEAQIGLSAAASGQGHGTCFYCPFAGTSEEVLALSFSQHSSSEIH